MASGYERHHSKNLPTQRDRNSNSNTGCQQCVVHAINVLDVFCSCYSVISAVSQT